MIHKQCFGHNDDRGREVDKFCILPCQRNPKEVIQEMQKKHAFAMSDCEKGTTIGVILTGTRVKVCMSTTCTE